MCPNPQFPADMDTLTEEILNEKLQFLCSDMTPKYAIKLGIVDWDKFEMYPAENVLSEERIAKVNTSNLAHPNELIDYKVRHGSRDYVIVPDTLKFYLILVFSQVIKHLVWLKL